ncbi:MAG TPA: ZIP family metal transporter [Clostridia bacterium]|nr:ZIP family metal transporter [Clostridia bacterium]
MELSPVITVTLYGLTAGVLGTGLGGLIAYILPKPKPAAYSAALGLAAGIMLSIVFLELLVESMALTNMGATLIGLTLGVFGFAVLDSNIPHHHPVQPEHYRKENDEYLRKGILLAIGIALHNIPEGLAIGAGYAVSEQMGIVLALVIGFHNIPEGMAVALPLKAAGEDNQGIIAAVAAGAPMGIGALLGALVGNISPLFLGISLSFAAGAMLYIVCDELIPDAFASSKGHGAILGIGAGVILGIMLTSL